MRIKISWRKPEPTIIENTLHQAHTSYMRLWNKKDKGHEFYVPWDTVDMIEVVEDDQKFYGDEEPKKDK